MRYIKGLTRFSVGNISLQVQKFSASRANLQDPLLSNRRSQGDMSLEARQYSVLHSLAVGYGTFPTYLLC
jgi:hypothetical protein